MIKENHIVDVRLPLSQNFQELKKEGLDFIQKYGSSDWTNLNQSDPGVTILDQLCYALTELGYCGDFPIEDILTNSKGHIDFKNQFYLPYEILTTAPVTITDYKRIIIDNFPEVYNVLLIPIKSSTNIGNTYNVFLYLNPQITRRKQINNVIWSVYSFLNDNRNLNEFFALPQILEKVPVLLQGRLEIESPDEFGKIANRIQEKLTECIFPRVIQYGYDKLKNDGASSDSIFNGPQLKNGWITVDQFSGKKDEVNTLEIGDLLSSVEGVKSISKIKFIEQSQGHFELFEPLDDISATPSQIIKFEFVKSINNGVLQCFWKGANLVETHFPEGFKPTAKLTENINNINEFSAVKIKPELPIGKYRDIEDYYSIQNTFPEIYGIGLDAKIENAPEYQVAQSRQLMGYLTLFDQILANQFSQLANIDNVFSFTNAMKRDEFDQKPINNTESSTVSYPDEYLDLSPNYYYQPLYKVPNIRPILKQNESFNFEDKIEDAKKREKNSWKAYKHDPYNPYIKGLRDFIDDEQVNVSRRNEVLDHLLARHGESPLIIDMMVEGSLWTGNGKKDRIIYKSAYLQNLGLLSYFRMKGYNMISSDEVRIKVKKAQVKIDKITSSNFSKNFIYRSSDLYKLIRIYPKDFVNFSAIELKLNLLLGLSIQYLNFIKSDTNKGNTKEVRQALWFLKERKGMIMLESNLLLRYATFRVEIYDVGQKLRIRFIDRLTLNELISIKSWVRDHVDFVVNGNFGEGCLQIGEKEFDIKLLRLKTKKLEKSRGLKIRVKDIKWGNNQGVKISVGSNSKDLNFIFPSYIPQFSSVAFKQRVELFLQENLPVNIRYRVYYPSYNELKKIIPAFANFYNAIRSNGVNTKTATEVLDSADTLATVMYKINQSKI